MKRKILKILLIFIIVGEFIINTSYADNQKSKEVQIDADYAVLIEADTGKILYSKNESEKAYPASTTKILTAIIAIENCDLQEIATVNKSAVKAIPAGYSSAYLSEGEQITVGDLLTVFLVHSANDAGYVLAEHISGDIPTFAKLMNEKVKEIGCENTHFTNPSGIHENEHYTTAYDMALMARYCMKNETFRKIVAMEKCTINSTNKSDARTYQNTNDLINKSSKNYIKDCIGIKTGYTTEAKNCLISECNKDGLELISVVLGANKLPSGESSRYADSINLYEYGYENFSLKKLASKEDIIQTIEINNGTKGTRKLDLILKDDVYGIVEKNTQILDPKIDLKNISAPIAQNEVVGTITYTIGDISYTKELLASHQVIKDDFLMLILGIILFLIIFLILIFILISRLNNKKKRKRKYTKLEI